MRRIQTRRQSHDRQMGEKSSPTDLPFRTNDGASCKKNRALPHLYFELAQTGAFIQKLRRVVLFLQIFSFAAAMHRCGKWPLCGTLRGTCGLKWPPRVL